MINHNPTMFSSKNHNLANNLANDNPPSNCPKPEQTRKDQVSPFPDRLGVLDNHYFDFASPPFRNLLKAAEVAKVAETADFATSQLPDCKKESPFASLRFVNDFASRSRRLNGEKIRIPRSGNDSRDGNDEKLSTIARIRLAGQHFIDFYSSKADDMSDVNDVSCMLSVSSCGLSDDEVKDIELLLQLLASADKIGKQLFDDASKLIESCGRVALRDGDTVERLVYYFSEAIRAKINRETGRDTEEGLENMQVFDLQKALMGVEASILAFHRKVPFSQVCQFSSMYTIIENVGDATRVHVVDLEIRTGMQYTVMMQTIASRSDIKIKTLKITAIGTRSESKIITTRNRLADFARSINIQFSFKIIMVDDILDFNAGLLDLDDREKVAVYSSCSLSHLIVKPDRLEHLMREIRNINPCVTIIMEVEANHTSPAFVNRFIEALFFYGALFDSISVCFADDEMNRMISECVYYSYCIRNIVAADGDERTIRHVGMDVWRSFFARFGMSEIELSVASLNEAKMLINNFECGHSCTLQANGRCFVVEWNNVPIFSVSAWKFV